MYAAPVLASIDVEAFRQPLPGHSWRPEVYFVGPGWGGIATNSDQSLIAVAADDNICIFDATSGRPPYGAHGALVTVIGDVCAPRSICFAAETLLVADAGNHRIAEFNTGTGVLVRSIAVWEESWIHGVACSGAVIAVTFVQALEVYLVDYASCAVLHRISTASPPVGVRLTSDGTRVVWVEYYSQPVVRKCRVDTGETVSCQALRDGSHHVIDVLLCEGGNADFGDDDDVVVATSFPYRDGSNSIWSVNEDGKTRHDAQVAGRVTAMAWCGANIAYKMHGDTALHFIPATWSQSLRCAWISTCILLCSNGGSGK
jgi:hypothetical protein